MHWNAALLPIGVMLGASFGADGLLFRVAGQIEQAGPWRTRMPVISEAI
jgi:amidase